MSNIKYFFKRKVWQIRNVFKWLPVIWNQFDFDYHYSIEVFKFQLEKQAKFLESGKACTTNAKHNASRIRTAIRLMKKVYDEDYVCEYQVKLAELYGKDVLDWEFEEIGDKGSSILKHKYEKWENASEINTIQSKLFLESHKKQVKAHRILWAFIEHNIRHFWD